MATGTVVTVEEYLRTSYDPDREYVDGVVLERNVGEKDHSRLQALLTTYLVSREKTWNIHVYTEQRVQVSATHYRVPDICVIAGPEPQEQIFTSPPFLCIEILSPEDRAAAMQRKIADYLRFGVRYVWVIDPETLQAWVHTASGSWEAEASVLKTDNPDMVVPLPELFA